MEVWMKIEGYEGLYEVSNEGRVRSLNYRHTGEIRILKPAICYGGYLQVHLCKDGKKKFFKVHRLVANAFIANTLNLPQVNHINEVKIDNRVENLEWCTCKDNINHGTHNQRANEAKTNGKLSKPVLQFTKNGEFVREWPSVMEVQRVLGFHCSTISKCCRGERKSYKGFIWKYL